MRSVIWATHVSLVEAVTLEATSCNSVGQLVHISLRKMALHVTGPHQILNVT